jgi:hypothetical protein
MRKLSSCVAGCFCLGLLLPAARIEAVPGLAPGHIHGRRPAPPPGPTGDPVLRWNAVALQAVADDHSGTFGPPAHGGPNRAARVLAIVHAAIYDAVNSIDGTHQPYLTFVPVGRHSGISIHAAVAKAGAETLSALYPAQKSVFETALQSDMAQIQNGSSKALGMVVGIIAAKRLLQARRNDGADAPQEYTPGTLPGEHRVDPINPNQGFLDPDYSIVTPFVVESSSQFRSPPPPALTSPEYTDAFNQVKTLGGDETNTPTTRTPEQTEIGIYWAYDGSKHLGPPPRLYNQIVRVIATDRGNTIVENARLFALINIAQADGGLNCWETKYVYNFWRPVLGIRESDEDTGPSGLGDGNPATAGDTGYVPLCAPASNGGGTNFTPAFPAYPSGHATFGSTVFRMVALFYGTDEIPFTFTSDELNGVTTDNLGNTRPLSPRSFTRLSDATMENALSRIYLGIHWAFDASEGINMGTAVADYVFANSLQPLP